MNFLQKLTLKTLGRILLGYAAIAFLAATFGIIKDVDPSWYNQLIIVIGLGIGAIYLNSKGFTIPGLFNKVLSYFKLKPISETVNTDILDTINDLAEALNKAGDTEGVALCKQLNTHVFDTIYRPKTEVKVVTDASK